MKKILSLALVLWASTTFAFVGEGMEREQVRSLIKRELEHHLKFPSSNNLTVYDEAYIELVIKIDSRVEVKNMNVASDNVRKSIVEQISRIHLIGPIAEEQTFVFRVCFHTA